MITKATLKSLLDKSAIGYAQCWKTLEQIKSRTDKDDFGKDLVEFQPTLCEIMLRLEKAYVSIAWEKETLIAKKSSLSSGWFNQRMRTLGAYEESIEKCIYIGKSLGDSFAWIFYENERSLLEQHLKHEEISHLPTGIGGIGELAFVKQVKFQDYLIIYHGITTYLRLGDVSLFDFSTKKITAIGEIKTRQIDKEKAEVTVVFAGWRPNNLNDNSKDIASEEPGKFDEQRALLTDLSPKMKERLGRQLKSMSRSLEQREKKSDQTENLFGEIYLDELEQLYTKLKTSRFMYQQAGAGLLLLAYKNRSQLLSSKLMPRNTEIDWGSKLQNAREHVLSITDLSRSDNVININSFFYDRQGRALLAIGTVPLFWWPLKIELIQAIIFQEIFILTVFNPIHFFKKLQAVGFKIEQDGHDGTYSVLIEHDGKVLKLERFGYYLRLIQSLLVKEDAVVGPIKNSTDAILEKNLPPYSRVELHIHHFFH